MANTAAPSQPVIINNNNNVVVAGGGGGSGGHYDPNTARMCCLIPSLFGVRGMHRCYLDDYGTCCCQVRSGPPLARVALNRCRPVFHARRLWHLGSVGFAHDGSCTNS